MADNLWNLMQLGYDKRILAVVGAGHEKDIIKLLKKKEPSISFTFSTG